MNKTTLPAGKYFIGDPCYAVFDHEWDEYLDPYFKYCDKHGYRTGCGLTHNGRQCFTSSTAFGDGVYDDQEGNSYPVDAGMIGATPVEGSEYEGLPNGRDRLGLIHTFDKPFDCWYQEGVIHIGHFVIDTN